MGYPNAAPFEILGGPFDLYIAATGATFPDIDQAPGGAWTLVGTAGADSYAEDGITVSQPQSVNFWRSLASTGPKKAFRSSEDLMIKLIVADVSAENYRLAFEGNSITTAPASSGVPGTKAIGLSRGPAVGQKALLLRGPSPYGDDMAMQYEIPVVSLAGSPELVYKKDGPALLSMEFTALEDPDAANDAERFGRLIMQTDPAGS